MDEKTTQIAATTAPRLELRAAGRTWYATADRAWTIGRALDVDVHLDNPRVSRDQAVLEPTAAGWVLVNHSRNGMFVDGNRVEHLTVNQPIAVSLGSAASGEVLQLSPVADRPTGTAGLTAIDDRPGRREGTTIARPPTAVVAMGQVAITIGRAPENNVVFDDDLLVSRRHAVLRRADSRWELVDLGSSNGTFVNGTRIDRTVIGPEDIVGIGHQLMHLAGDRLVQYVDTGDVSFSASDLRVVTKKGKVLLAGVSFDLPQRSFLAVIGPSGAGKSTMLGALTGFRPPAPAPSTMTSVTSTTTMPS